MQTAYWQLWFSDRLTGARNPARLPTTIRSRRIRCAPFRFHSTTSAAVGAGPIPAVSQFRPGRSGRAFDWVRMGIPARKGRVAQLVRAPASHAGGRRFESCRAHHSSLVKSAICLSGSSLNPVLKRENVSKPYQNPFTALVPYQNPVQNPAPVQDPARSLCG